MFWFGFLSLFLVTWIFVPDNIVSYKQYCRQRCLTPSPSRPRTVVKQAVAHSTGVRVSVREGAATGAHRDSQADLLLASKWRSLVQKSQMQYSHLSNQNASTADFPSRPLSCS